MGEADHVENTVQHKKPQCHHVLFPPTVLKGGTARNGPTTMPHLVSGISKELVSETFADAWSQDAICLV